MTQSDRDNFLLLQACLGSGFTMELMANEGSFSGKFREARKPRRGVALLLAPVLRPMPKVKKPKVKVPQKGKLDVPHVSTPTHRWLDEGF